jgi:hypothetical protein
MKKVYKEFIKKYPQVANVELEELCNIFKNEVDGSILHQVKLGAKSRELVCNLPHDFSLKVSYSGKSKDIFDIWLYYKETYVKRVVELEARHIFYRIDNIKTAIAYTLEKRKSDVDFYLPLYKKLSDILITTISNYENNSLVNWIEEKQRLFELEENKDLILKGILKATQPFINYSYGYSDKTVYEVNERLLYDILFKELKKFISFQFLVDEVERNEETIKTSNEKIHNLVNNF